jgi:formylglycine-generating enzyme required for sulfatase activity
MKKTGYSYFMLISLLLLRTAATQAQEFTASNALLTKRNIGDYCIYIQNIALNHSIENRPILVSLFETAENRVFDDLIGSGMVPLSDYLDQLMNQAVTIQYGISPEPKDFLTATKEGRIFFVVEVDKVVNGRRLKNTFVVNASNQKIVNIYPDVAATGLQVKTFELLQDGQSQAAITSDPDLAAYQAARQSNTLAGYQRYLSNYPNGRFLSEAQLFSNQLGGAANQITGNQSIDLQPPDAPFRTFTETVNGVSFKMVAIIGGSFQMGSYDGQDDEKPVHSVTVSDFYMGETEVTVAQFEAFVKATNYQTDAEKRTGGYGSWIWNGSEWEEKDGVTWRCDVGGNVRSRSDYNHPVLHVSWNDAEAYCEWLSRTTGKSYKLPTEAEWEYAAGGGSTGRTKWAGTDSESSLGSYAWYYANSNSQTHPVGTKSPNGLGLYDMSGNVWEWCSDWYKGYPGSSGVSDYTGSSRVSRGGSWNFNSGYCRVANRYYFTPFSRYNYLGFRVVLVP